MPVRNTIDINIFSIIKKVINNCFGKKKSTEDDDSIV